MDVDSRHVRMKYEDQLRNDLNEFESACEETRNDMLKNGPASDKSLLDLHAGALKLNEFKTKIVDLSNRREALRDSEKAFQFPPRSVSSLQELRENIEEYMSCYAVIQRFDSKVKVHSRVLWDAIDIEKLRAIAEESKRDCETNITESSKTFELIMSIKKSIALFEETLDLFCTLLPLSLMLGQVGWTLVVSFLTLIEVWNDLRCWLNLKKKEETNGVVPLVLLSVPVPVVSVMRTRFELIAEVVWAGVYATAALCVNFG